MNEPVLVSACLLGVGCRFDCESKTYPAVVNLARTRHLVPVCPEQLAGLPTPRPRHEQREGRIVSEHGQDATQAFHRGAEQALHIARVTGCRSAILKARSPSCGVGTIYDGSFSRKLVAGDGVLASRLRQEGISVCSEDELE
jgi:uncharacterized protein YbbK (DUF523 family)